MKTLIILFVCLLLPFIVFFVGGIIYILFYKDSRKDSDYYDY